MPNLNVIHDIRDCWYLMEYARGGFAGRLNFSSHLDFYILRSWHFVRSYLSVIPISPFRTPQAAGGLISAARLAP